MGLLKKKSLMDQAGDYVDQVRPHAEAAMESARDFVQDTVVPALADAQKKAGPAIADAREKAAPVIAAGAAKAAERANHARDLADAKVLELKGEKPKKKGKLKKFVLFAGIAGGVAFVAKKLQGGSQDNWQSSYTPTPAPSRPTPPARRGPERSLPRRGALGRRRDRAPDHDPGPPRRGHQHRGRPELAALPTSVTHADPSETFR